MSNDLRGFWKDEKQDAKTSNWIKKETKKKSRKQKNRLKRAKYSKSGFYMTDVWRKLRYRVIRKYKGICMACGSSYKEHGVRIHVDHIKPRSRYPELALDFNNLQVLCENCNLGKGVTDETDWRPNSEELAELKILREMRKRI